jgi:antitoxin VapB
MPPEEIGTPRSVLGDTETKDRRVRAFLRREGLDALVLGRQDNFAWITTGGDSHVITTSEMGAAYAVLTQDHKWLVSHEMDGLRLIEEQAPGQGYELVTLYWHEGDPQGRVLELTEGMKVGADFALPGAIRYGPEIVDLHYPLTDLEIERYRWIGRKVNGILTEVARGLEPGVTETEVEARLLFEYAMAGMTIDVLIVGFDDRIGRYRHPMPGDAVLERYALLHPAAQRWGLHANVTRLVHFGEPPAEIAGAMDGVTTIGAHVAALMGPGVRFADLLAEEKRLYAGLGYADEWNYHFQGGITGYVLADPVRCLDPDARLVPRQAYDYFITITGAKYEECMLLTEDGPETVSLHNGWPTRVLDTPYGQVEVSEVLIR